MVTITGLWRALYQACSLGASKNSEGRTQPTPGANLDWGIKFTSDIDARMLVTEGLPQGKTRWGLCRETEGTYATYIPAGKGIELT